MDKMKRNELTKTALLAHGENAPEELYCHLWETHVALFARCIADKYPTAGKTFRFYCSLQMALAADYNRLGDTEKARAYHLAVVRTAAKLLRKKDK